MAEDLPMNQQIIAEITTVRFTQPGFPISRGHIRDFDGSLLGRI
jgi:hypothetical protein